VKVYIDNIRRNEIIMDMEIAWDDPLFVYYNILLLIMLNITAYITVSL